MLSHWALKRQQLGTFKAVLMILGQSSRHRKFDSGNNPDALSEFNALKLLIFYFYFKTFIILI